MKKIKLLFISISILAYINTYSQIGGSSVYRFLDMPVSVFSASSGGLPVAAQTNFSSNVYYNPSLLRKEMNNQISLNYTGYFADIKYGYAGFAKSVNEKHSLSAGLFFLDYGEFTETDQYGNIIGKFYASDYSMNLSYSYQFNKKIRFGVSAKPIYSVYEKYNSTGLGFDIGVNYFDSTSNISASVVARNAGWQIDSYNEENADLPFEISFGISKRLKHAPFRVSVTYRHLQKWDILYDDPVDDIGENQLIDEGTTEDSKLQQFSDKFFRHFIFGVEFLPSENFFINLAYNIQRRAEMKIDEKPGLAGFSGGIGIKISKFRISYARSVYHLAGASSHISVSTNLDSFMKKGKKKNS